MVSVDTEATKRFETWGAGETHRYVERMLLLVFSVQNVFVEVCNVQCVRNRLTTMKEEAVV